MKNVYKIFGNDSYNRYFCGQKRIVILVHISMSVKVTGLESTEERKAVYKTGTGQGNGDIETCVWGLAT